MDFKLDHIYRYPVKGLSAQPLTEVNLTTNQPLPWDRAFAIENGPSGFEPQAPSYLQKIKFLMLMKQPELALLRTQFDETCGTLTIHLGGNQVAIANLFDPQSQSELLTFLKSYCEKPPRGELAILHQAGHAFTDSRTQDISLINLASVKDLSTLAGTALDPIRFRGNLYISGPQPWEENDWVGKTLQIGDVHFHVRKRTVRCAATNANPETGKRDQQLPQLIMQTYDHSDCGIHLVAQNDGTIHQNMPVKLID